MTKAELRILERAFEAEINGGRYQSKAKLARSLVERGYLADAQENRASPLGIFHCEWLELTHLGRLEYCLTCEDEPPP